MQTLKLTLSEMVIDRMPTARDWRQRMDGGSPGFRVDSNTLTKRLPLPASFTASHPLPFLALPVPSLLVLIFFPVLNLSTVGSEGREGDRTGSMSETPPPFQEASRCDVCHCSFTTFRRRVCINLDLFSSSLLFFGRFGYLLPII